MLEYLGKKLTNDYNEVPLFSITRENYVHDEYLIDVNLHPSLKSNSFITDKLNNIILYITKNYNFLRDTLLLKVTFNLNKYLKTGSEGSCDFKIHVDFKNDNIIKNQLNNLIDYIRANYNMEELSNL